MNIIDVLHELDYNPKKKGSTHGGEYCSPCPYCQDGDDRFVAWPDLVNKNGNYMGGRFWCRVCNKGGDAIILLRDLQGLTYPQACEKLKVDPGERKAPRQDLIHLIAENPPELWIEKATAFVKWCHTQLLQNDQFLSALTKRGLTLETIKTFKLGYNSERLFRQRPEWGLSAEQKKNGKPRLIWIPPGIVIPTFEGDTLVKLKIRNRDYKSQLEQYEALRKVGRELKYSPSKYVVISGSKKCPSVYGNQALGTLLVLESELDAILMIQQARNLCFCLALGGSSQPLDLHKERIVRGVENLLFCPDYDEAGKESWDRWIRRFPDTKRILTPYGKDPTEALECGVNLREWIEGAITSITAKK